MDIIRFLNLRYFFDQIISIFTDPADLSFFERLLELWLFLLPFLKILSTILSLLFLILAIYSYIRLKQVQAEEKEKFANHYEPTEGELPKNERWQKIMMLTDSENSNDWRAAIMEADTILDEIVTRIGYHGENLGEKMRGIEKSDFNTLDHAWEAHKVRNKIAHDGGDFVLTQREAKRVINLFGQVFVEFGYI